MSDVADVPEEEAEAERPWPVTLCQRDWCRRELVGGRCPEHGEDTGT